MDFRRKSTSCDTGSGTVEKLVPENIGILLLCALELEIRLGVKIPPQLPANVAKKSLPRQGLKWPKQLKLLPEPAETTTEPSDRGKWALSRCNGGHERRALKGLIGSLVKGRIKGSMQMKTTVVVQEGDD